MSLKKWNRILGWVVFGIALLVYGITMEKSASFWDCGEFIAAAHKLQIVHPPGAPIYLMLGRLFSFFLPPDKVAVGVNFLSAFSTALAAMFIFWSTTILAKRMLNYSVKKATNGEVIAILGAGLVAAFAFIFQDSQWFNAVEAEVYAVSTGLTAAVVYMALKWSEVHDQEGADRWLMAIALVIGISLGVHLLNLLAIPAIALLYYFYKSETFTAKGVAISFAVGAIILLLIQYGIILELPKLASGFEVLFVNNFGLPFSSGILFLTALVFAIPILLIFFAKNEKPLFLYIALGIIAFLAIGQFFKSGSGFWNFVKAVVTLAIAGSIYLNREKLGLVYKLSLAFFFIMIGYLSFMFVPIRSSANTPIDINNPDNVFSLLSYLNREQYGDRPLLYGPIYTAELTGIKTVGNIYAKKGNKYEVIDDKIDYEFDASDQMLFPRAWDFREDRKMRAYSDWLELGSESPNMYQNMRFFYTYQLDFMYWRYFMWNFAGRQNSEQSHGEPDVGNWESGIPWTDNPRTIKADVYPDKIKGNASQNNFYFLPFVFGILGLILHWKFARKDAITILGLFLLTGIAIVIYLNQEPLQPRERDYAYVGSFLAFAMWIGLSVAGLYRATRSLGFKDLKWVMQSFAIIFGAMVIMGFGSNNPVTLFPIAVTLAVMVALIFVVAVLLKKLNGPQSAGLLTGLVLIAPMLMGAIGWNDHNRNELHLARATGANYLTSCNENAILFTEGDNDTYPLWYSQEVENTRPDIRIVNNSLLQADWYADQIRQPNGNQDGLTLSFDPEDYAAGKREVIYLNEKTDRISLQDLIRFIESDDPRTKVQTSTGSIDYFPASTFTLAIDKEAQIRNGLITPEEAEFLVDTMVIELEKDKLVRDEYLILDIIQQNINTRPIYFTGENLPNKIGLSPYTRREGASVRLLPIINPAYGTRAYSEFDPPIAKEKTLEYFKNGMDWGNISSGVYLEETGQRQVMRVLDYGSDMVYEFAKEGKTAEALETYNILKEQIYASSVPKDDLYFIFWNTGIIDALLQIEEFDEAYELTKQTNNSAKKLIQYHKTSSHYLPNSDPIRIEMIRVLATNTDAFLQAGKNDEAYENAKMVVDEVLFEFGVMNKNDEDLLNELVNILEIVQNAAEENGNAEIQAYLENALTVSDEE